jgi:hypothetical protein
MKIEIKGKSPYKGSKSPGVGYVYVLALMFIAIVAASVLSGGMIPVDPNGPGGPPTLPPYYGQEGDNDQQQIILPSGALTPDPKGNLQLKTFKVNTCSQTAVIDFLIDTSGSMQYEGKMDKLKKALKAFTKKMSKSSGVGMQTFSAVVKERVALGYYRDVKSNVQANIDSLQTDGWTRTRDGFKLAKQSINEAMQGKKFPGYKYYLVLMTDGVPELSPDQTRHCEAEADDANLGGAKRCFAKEEDPRGTDLDGVDVSQDLKNLGVEIYSIGLFSSNFASDKALQPYLEKMLQDVASTPTSEHYFTDQQDLTKVFDKIFTSICDQNIDELGGASQDLSGTNALVPTATVAQ